MTADINARLLKALKRLAFAADTSGGVAGRDLGLRAAIDEAVETIGDAERAGLNKNVSAVALGALGGAATKGISTPKKAAAARRNGKKGGRPKKARDEAQDAQASTGLRAKETKRKVSR